MYSFDPSAHTALACFSIFTKLYLPNSISFSHGYFTERKKQADSFFFHTGPDLLSRIYLPIYTVPTAYHDTLAALAPHIVHVRC